MREVMKNSLLYLRDEQKAASREKTGYLMSHLNSHQKTIGTWTILCAKKQKIHTHWKVSSWALRITPHFKYLLNMIPNNGAIELNLFCQVKVKSENFHSLCILFCVTMTEDLSIELRYSNFFFSCVEVSDLKSGYCLWINFIWFRGG